MDLILFGLISEMNYWWCCFYEEGDWEDGYACTAKSKNIFPTKQMAEASAKKHEAKTGHKNKTRVIAERRKRRKRK